MDCQEIQTYTIGFAGDVMIGRLVNEVISTTGYDYPWGDMLPILRKTDLNIINLETTLTKSEKAIAKVFNFKAYPDRVQTLLTAKIDVANLANNHILDFSEEGLIETIEVLDTAKILHCGAGGNETEARKPAIVVRKGVTIGVLGYTDNEPDWAASPHTPGTNYLQIGDIQRVVADVQKVREKVDILILTIHWGPNMREYPTPEFIAFAHQIIDSGVDIIHGHSAHIFQGIERYKGKLIMYDTGDFVDDYAVDSLLRNDRSFLFCVKIDKRKIGQIELIPVLIDNMQVNRAKGDDYRWLVEKIKERSRGFAVTIGEEKRNFRFEFRLDNK